MKTLSIAAANSGFAELVREAGRGEVITITRRAQPVAVMLSVEQYQRLQAAAASAADFETWLEDWRGRLAPGFDGITADEIERWLETS